MRLLALLAAILILPLSSVTALAWRDGSLDATSTIAGQRMSIRGWQVTGAAV